MPTVHPQVQKARDLMPLIVAAADAHDETRELTKPVVKALVDGGFFTMLRATLRLAGRPAAAAATPLELLGQAAGAIGFPVEPLMELATHAAGTRQLALQPADPRAAAYLAAVAKTAQFVDSL